MDAIVFILTSLICALAAFITKNEQKTCTCEQDEIDKRIQILEYMAKKRVLKHNKLSFNQIQNKLYHLHVDIDTTITRIQLNILPIQSVGVQQLRVHDVLGNVYTITSTSGITSSSSIFELEKPLHFHKIEFMYDATIIENNTSLFFHYGYGEYLMIETKIYNGKHIITNITKKHVDDEKIRNHFVNCIISFD